MTMTKNIEELESEILGIDDNTAEEPTESVEEGTVDENSEEQPNLSNDRLMLATVRRAMADVMKLEADADRKVLEEALEDQDPVDGKKTLEVTLPNGQKIASMSRTTADVWSYVFYDEAAFNTWFFENYPDDVETRTVMNQQRYQQAPTGDDHIDALLASGTVKAVTLDVEESITEPDQAVVNEILDNAAIEEGVLYTSDGNSIPGVRAEVKEKVTNSGFRFTKGNDTKRQVVKFALESDMMLDTSVLFRQLELEA